MKWLIVLGFLAASVFAAAQTAADLATEPHHHLLLQNDEARVFLLTLAPGEQSYVRHEHNFLFIPLQNGELVMWSQGAAPVQHFLFHQGEVHLWLGGRASGMRNDSLSSYRAVIVEFLNPKVTTYGYQYDTGKWDYGSGAIGPPVDPHKKFANRITMGAASATDVQLLAGDSFPPPEKKAGELLIAVSDVDLKVNLDQHLRRSSGEIAWIPAGRTWSWMNSSGETIRFAVVEFWEQNEEPGKH